jgi:hypothetical protein
VTSVCAVALPEQGEAGASIPRRCPRELPELNADKSIRHGNFPTV